MTEPPPVAPEGREDQAAPLPQPVTAPTPSRPPLRRSRTDRVISGVSGGLAAYLDIDPVIVRIGWVVLGFATGGAAVIGYVLMWLLMPEEIPGQAVVREPRPREASDQGRFIIGAVLVVVGCVWLAATLVPDFFRFRGLFALAVIAVGVALVVQGTRR